VTPAALKSNLEAWKMSPVEFSDYVGVSTKTVYNWLRGNNPIPKTIDIIAEFKQPASVWEWRKK